MTVANKTLSKLITPLMHERLDYVHKDMQSKLTHMSYASVTPVMQVFDLGGSPEEKPIPKVVDVSLGNIPTVLTDKDKLELIGVILSNVMGEVVDVEEALTDHSTVVEIILHSYCVSIYNSNVKQGLVTVQADPEKVFDPFGSMESLLS